MRISDWSSDVCSSDLFTIIDVPQIEQVHLFYLAQVQGPELDPGPESLEARYYDDAEIPWDDLSFRTDRKSVVQGKSVSVRVNLGGGRILKKKNKELIISQIQTDSESIHRR